MSTMVKVKLLREHEHAGYVRPQGSILELTAERANRLIGLGYAVKHVADEDFDKPAPAAAAKKS